jgi:hypothetical protein
MRQLILLTLALLLFSSVFASDEESLSRLLFYSNHHIYRFTVETGEHLALPDIEASPEDKWLLSPNGAYLLQMRDEENSSLATHRIYDLNNFRWADHESFTGQWNTAAWSPDSQTISFNIYPDDGTYAGELWFYSLEDQQLEKVYRTDAGSNLNGWSIGIVHWTAYENVLLVEDSYWIMGGSVNNINWLNRDTDEKIILAGAYYAYHEPKFSPDGEWFLMQIEERYVCRNCEGMQDRTEYGDIFLYHTADAATYRVTDSRYIRETFVSWLEDNHSFILAMGDKHFQFSIEDVLAGQAEVQEIPNKVVEYIVEDGHFYYGLLSPNHDFLALNDDCFYDKAWSLIGCALNIESLAGSVLVHVAPTEYTQRFYAWLP